jgi:hypothetical protein
MLLVAPQAATLRVGNYEGEEVFTPFRSLLPMVDPNDFVIGGWDISGLNMAEAMERGKVRGATPRGGAPVLTALLWSWRGYRHTKAGEGVSGGSAGAGAERRAQAGVRCSQAWGCAALCDPSVSSG